MSFRIGKSGARAPGSDIQAVRSSDKSRFATTPEVFVLGNQRLFCLHLAATCRNPSIPKHILERSTVS